MLMRHKDLPNNYITREVVLSKSVERFPFYVREYGYSNKKKIEFKNNYSYNDIVILYSYEGIVRFSKDKTTNYVQPHHIIISACNSSLHFTKTSLHWKFFYMVVSGAHTKLYYNLIRTKNSVIAINPLASTLNHFIDMMDSPALDSDYALMENSLLIHNVLFDLYKTTYNIAEARSFSPIQESDVNTAINYITKNYKQQLTIDDICQVANLSKYYFCKIFKEHTGISVHKYLNEFRVNKSKELLSYSKLSINAIAVEVGFNNALTYIRCFKTSMDMTPSEYRRYF